MSDSYLHNEPGYIELNSQLNLYNAAGEIQFDKDREAARQYFLQHVNPNTVFFRDLEEKLAYLVEKEYYEKEFLDQYSMEFIKKLFKSLYDRKYEFNTFVGAYKFYTSYALKTFDGKRYLERYEDRIAACALYLARGDEKLAMQTAEEIITNRFQPATPTFLNSGKKQRGELVSCFLLEVADDMNSIGRAINSTLQLSKRGGGVALNLSNLRSRRDPIKNIEGLASGVLPVMKLLEISLSYANQNGARDGAGAVWLSCLHGDLLEFLDCRREAASEEIRIKTLSLGIVIPDIVFELAKNDEDMYMFSPYDVSRKYGKPFADVNLTEVYRELVNDPHVKKTKIKARRFFQLVAETQFESGYPYIMYGDNVNNQSRVKGVIKHSNLCSEILQPSTESVINDRQEYETVGKDISCNLGSMCVDKTMDSPNFARTIETSIRALISVSDQSNIECVPSIQAGNDKSHAVGLGQMNLHGYFMREGIEYGGRESLEFTDLYFGKVFYHALWASTKVAKERGESFDGFEESKYYSGEAFDMYLEKERQPTMSKTKHLFRNQELPTIEDWTKLAKHVKKHGLYCSHLMAVAPTGSISYILNSTASIAPITSIIEIRKEGKLGQVYYPAAYLTQNNHKQYKDAFELGWKALIDVYAAATKHVDQGLSLTLYFKEEATTKDINNCQMYAWKKGIKTLYYIRVRNSQIAGTEMAECVSCSV